MGEVVSFRNEEEKSQIRLLVDCLKDYEKTREQGMGNLCDYLQTTRTELGFSRKDVAEKLNLEEDAIYHTETHRYSIYDDRILDELLNLLTDESVGFLDSVLF
jgi:ribosome-binding protein aMBF1 (putative translation factor)